MSFEPAPSASPPSPHPPTAPAATPPAVDRAASPDMPVLVVAEVAADRARLALVLRAAGYAPAACSPATVWASLRDIRPVLLVLVVPRPGGAALALYRRLRLDEAVAALPVVLLSAVPAAIVAARTADCPPEGLIHRPCPPSAVLAVVSELLAGRGGRAPGGTERMEHYTIRYRHVDKHGRATLIVTDGAGDACLFAAGALQLRRAGPDAAARLARRLAGSDAWTPVPPAAPYTLAGLRRLTAPPSDDAGR